LLYCACGHVEHYRLIKTTAFDPEGVKLLCEAYASLHDTGQPYLVREVIASRIIAMAKQGERDPDRLRC
jgi:hypothetical protein